MITEEYNISWTVAGTAAPIAEISPGSNATYGGRCSVKGCELFPDGVLRIDSLTSADNTTFIRTAKKGITTVIEQLRVNVYYRLTSPTLISSPSTSPLNGTSLRLTCDGGDQNVHNIYFYRNQDLISCDMSRLSCSTSSPILSFNPILDIDTGYYVCEIRNPASSHRSDQIFLNIGVRVSQVTLSKNTTSPITVGKDSVALTCSSYGSDVSYNWTLKGSPLPQNSRYNFTNNNSTLIISPVTRSDQGAFMCGVSNYLNSGISNPLSLTWLPDGEITCDAQRSDQNIQLYCVWPGGNPPAQVYMTYHNVHLTELNGVTTVIPSSQSPPGTALSCNGTYQGSSETCSLVIDRPQYPGFINDSTTFGKKGSSISLSVTLSGGIPAKLLPSKFSWFLVESNLSEVITGKDISVVSNEYSSFLIVHYMTKERSGRYICIAENNIGNNSFTFNVEVEKDEVLSAGAIAGIVIGCIALLLLSALVYLAIHKHKKSTRSPK